MYRLKAKSKYYWMAIIIMEVLLAVVELPQLPLLLLLKFDVHNDSCAGAVRGLLLLFVMVWWMTQFIAVVYSSGLFSLFKHDLFLCTPWQCCLVYSLGLPIILNS